MRKIIFLLTAILFVKFTSAQVSPTEKKLAFDLVKANAHVLSMNQQDVDNMDVSSTYVRPESGIRMVYLQQQFLDIPVHNKMLVLAFKNNQLVSQAGYFINYIEQRINAKNAMPAITAEAALQAALSDQGIAMTGLFEVIRRDAHSVVYGRSNYSSVDMEVKQVWLPVNNEKEVMLTWQVELAPLKSSDHWLIRVDAQNGKVLDKNNYTVHENFNELGDALRQLAQEAEVNQLVTSQLSQSEKLNSPSVVNSATYRVIPFPAESPMHPGGTAALVTDPWNLAPGNATSLKWNYNGTTYYDSTRGNNVWAQEDRDNNNTTYGRAGVSSTAQPNLTIDYVPDYTVAPTTTTFQRFATTNLFYWNNIIHDILYQYGFDEVSGNFQANNQGRGGTGNDYVVADAQDGGGTNNANFSTPVDGSLPRMQMYLGTNVTPNRDGDLDNGVIAHEYGHGLSNRLTGGPANSSCLSHAEQGGEGWSDYLALMLTTNWATATVNDGTLSRPIGNYLFGQTVSGAGIRTYPYSTNMSVNPNTYAMMAGTTGSVHRIGEIWCSALWDMTWEIIAMDGINTNLFNPTGAGGNSVALKLVLEGMRLQPCSPGYIDARNAILRADTLLYSAKYSCAIWKAFARRGMGRFASQGSSSSYTDQVADYTDNGGISLRLTQSVTQQQEGLNVTYTTTVSAGTCGAISNYTIRDTLPSNVTYVSGGTYDAVNRVVSFPVNLAVGTSQAYVYTVMINNGSYYSPITIFDESVATTSIPAGWTTTSSTTTLWTTSTAQKVSAPNSLFSLNLTTVSDQKLETTTAFTVPANPPYFTFQGYINSEASWDGGVVEITTNNGTTWTDLGSLMVSGGYNSALSSSTNPLSGRSTFNGNSNGFVKTSINLASYAGQSVKIRFRFGSDASVAGTGWYVDDIQMKNVAQVSIRSNLFNNNNVRVSYGDTTTLILQATNCVAGAINTQPAAVSVCVGGNASFSIAATGTSLTYQWQQSTNGGSSFSDIIGAVGTTLTIANLQTASNGYNYRCIINGTCTNSLISNAVSLTVQPLPAIPVVIDNSRCGPGAVTLSVVPVSGVSYDWYATSSGGTAIASGNTFSTGTINTTTTFYVQARNTQTGCISLTRIPVIATVKNATSYTLSVTSCDNYTWNGTVYTTSGTYTYLTTNAAGCDSTAILNLTKKNKSIYNLAVTTCDSYIWNGNTYNLSGNYTYNTFNAEGCDSSVYLNLTIRNSTLSATTISACDSYSWNGNVYNSSGTYTYITDNANGCDSTAVLKLTIKNSSSHVLTVTSCNNYSWNGQLYVNSGTYTYATTNSVGCDSLSILNFTRKFATTYTIGVTVCDSYTWNGNTYNASGTYTYRTFNAEGCDSTVFLNLTVNHSSSSSTNVAACQSYSWNGAVYFSSGSYTYNTSNAEGCDSIAILVLTISSRSQSNTVISACDNYSWNGNTYAASGNYTYNTIGGSGCDSFAILNLTIRKKTTSTTSIGICSNQLPYVWNGISFTIGGLHIVTLVNAAGCDSIARLLLDVAQTPAIFQVTGGGSYFTGGSGVSVGLSGSESGVIYQLLLNGQPTGISTAGNGSALNFGAQIFAGAYTIIAGPGTLCQQYMNGQASVTISNQPPVVFNVTGGGTYCSGSSAGVSVGLSGSELGVNYQLMRSNGTVNVGAPLPGTGSALIFANQTTADAYSVKAVNAVNGSSTLMNGSVLVRIASSTSAASTPGTITGPSNVCMYIGQGTAVYTIRQVANATSYLWSVPSGLTIVGAATDTILTVTVSSTFTSGTLSVVSKNGCFNNSTSTARTLALSKAVPAAPAAIFGTTDVCAFIGSNATSAPVSYFVNKVTNALSYNWTVPAGVSIISGQGDTLVNLVFSSSFVSGNITVTSVSACGNSSTAKSLTVYKRTAATPGIIQKEFSPSMPAITSVCGLVSESYKIRKVTYATSYLWTLSSGVGSVLSHSNLLGLNDTSIVLNFNGQFTRDTLKVAAVTACSISAFRTIVLTALNAAPAVTTLTGSSTPCIGNVLTYVAVAAAPTTAQSPVAVFRWTRPNNTSIVSANADSSTISISFNAGFTGGSIAVKGQTACGIAGTAKTLTLQYATPTPSAITSSTGSYNACIGNQITYTVVVAAPSSSQRAASVYRWTKPANTSIVSANADSSAITISFNAGYTGGAITVKGQTACGLQGSAKSQTLTHSGCPTGTFAKSAQPINLNEIVSIIIYPNPAKGAFKIKLSDGSKLNAYRIVDMNGKEVYSNKQLNQSDYMFNNRLNAGVYYLEVMSEGKRLSTKLIRQ